MNFIKREWKFLLILIAMLIAILGPAAYQNSYAVLSKKYPMRDWRIECPMGSYKQRANTYEVFTHGQIVFFIYQDGQRFSQTYPANCVVFLEG